MPSQTTAESRLEHKPGLQTAIRGGGNSSCHPVLPIASAVLSDHLNAEASFISRGSLGSVSLTAGKKACEKVALPELAI